MTVPNTDPGAWLAADELAEYHRLRAAERRRARQRQLRAQAPTATGKRVVSMLRVMLPKLADHVALGAVPPGEIKELRVLLDDAVNVAIGQLREQGYSWPEVGRELGITHQVAHKRWQRHQRRQAAR